MSDRKKTSIRGGAWNATYPVHTGASFRNGFFAPFRGYDGGFRCVKRPNVNP